MKLVNGSYNQTPHPITSNPLNRREKAHMCTMRSFYHLNPQCRPVRKKNLQRHLYNNTLLQAERLPTKPHLSLELNITYHFT